MTPEQYLSTFDSRIQYATKRVAEMGLAEVLDYVPIDTGALRRSGKTQSEGNDAAIVFADSSIPYTRYQYYSAKRHVVRNKVLSRMLTIIPPDIKIAVTGLTNKQRYGAAYRYAIKAGLLANFSRGVQWFEFLNENKNLQERMRQELIRRFNE